MAYLNGYKMPTWQSCPAPSFLPCPFLSFLPSSDVMKAIKILRRHSIQLLSTLLFIFFADLTVRPVADRAEEEEGDEDGTTLRFPGTLSAGDPRLHLEPHQHPQHIGEQQQQQGEGGEEGEEEDEEGAPGEVVLAGRTVRDFGGPANVVFVGMRNLPREEEEEEEEEEEDGKGWNVVSIAVADRLGELMRTGRERSVCDDMLGLFFFRNFKFHLQVPNPTDWR